MVRIVKGVKEQVKDESSESSDDYDELDDSIDSVQVPMHTVGEIVWAKVRGHAWWPAKIGKIFESETAVAAGQKHSNDVNYLILFIGDKSRSQLN